ncbi:MAG: peptidoglycan-associated lipoprotein [Gammaproteobacteria bacterium]|nr:MAG: peptidoglycan-associated lipoprotein [Gammaproteobacteria bacterium]RLA54053.1 MAG: peptidoglycan-associated lipoprotein [Gammaproteobacteria bacterium]
MKCSAFKAIFLVSTLSLLITACSSSPSTTDTDAGSSAGTTGTGISNGGVTTGSVSDGGLSSGTLDTSGDVDTVFYFEYDKAVLTPDSLVALRIHAQRLIANPVSVRLEGHADERGTREYNMALGERRAYAVQEFLILQGVDGSILEVISYGEEQPEVMGSNDAAWGLNRRATIR